MTVKKRNFKRERELAKRRGETGVGSASGDATRHRARRKLIASGTAVPAGKEVGHKKSLKSGGTNARKNLKVQSVKSNRSAGGKAGNRAAKGRKKR